MFARIVYQVQVFLFGHRSQPIEIDYPGLAEAVRPLTHRFIDAPANDER
jgi:hypothetical protein